MEPLEPRALFALAELDFDTSFLRVTGSDESDRIDIALEDRLIVVRRGEERLTFVADDVRRINIDARGGDDAVRAPNIGDLPLRIVGGAGRDTLVAGEGDDTLIGNAGADLLRGGGGRDVIRGHGGRNVIHGGAGRDRLYGGRSDDRISGGGGADAVAGDDGNDQLSGDKGNDLIWGGWGDDQILGGGDDDALFAADNALYFYTFRDRIDGGPGHDALRSYDSRDDRQEQRTGYEVLEFDFPPGTPFRPNETWSGGRSIGEGVISVRTEEPGITVRQWGILMTTPLGRLDTGFGEDGIIAVATTREQTNENGRRFSSLGTESQRFFPFSGGRILYYRVTFFYQEAADGTPILGIYTFGVHAIKPDGSIDPSFVFDRTNRLPRADVPFFHEDAGTHMGRGIIGADRDGTVFAVGYDIGPDGTLTDRPAAV